MKKFFILAGEASGDIYGDELAEELRRTLRHELTHHVENKAGDRTLEKWDEEQRELWLEGEPLRYVLAHERFQHRVAHVGKL